MIVKQKPFCSLFILEFDRKYTTEFKLLNLCKGLSFQTTEFSKHWAEYEGRELRSINLSGIFYRIWNWARIWISNVEKVVPTRSRTPNSRFDSQERYVLRHIANNKTNKFLWLHIAVDLRNFEVATLLSDCYQIEIYQIWLLNFSIRKAFTWHYLQRNQCYLKDTNI